MMNSHSPDARRRRTLLLLGAAGTGMLNVPAAAQSAPACIVTPEQTEGPYFVDERLNRPECAAIRLTDRSDRECRSR